MGFKKSLFPYKVTDANFYSPLDQHAREPFRGEMQDRSISSYWPTCQIFGGGTHKNGVCIYTPAMSKDPAALPGFILDTILEDVPGEVKPRRWSPLGDFVTALFVDGHAKVILMTKP